MEVKLGKKENNNKNIPEVTSGIKQGSFTLGVFWVLQNLGLMRRVMSFKLMIPFF